MNLGFYGHTNTMVFTTTEDGKFKKRALLGGIRQIHLSASMAVDANTLNVHIEDTDADPNSNEYRKDYYGLSRYKTTDKKSYFGVDKYLGYEAGETLGDIFSVLPDDQTAAIDILFVWDEGYGGLSIPTAGHVLWASDKALPDKAQFEKIADKCFLFLDGNVLRKAGAMISRQISWERTATEFVAEIQNNPAISYLLKARLLFITFGLDGGIIILPKGSSGQIEASMMLTHGGAEGAISGKQPNSESGVFIFSFMANTLITTAAGLANFAKSGHIPSWETDDVFNEFLNTMIRLLMRSENRNAKIFENTENDAVKWGSVLRPILEAGEFLTEKMTLEAEKAFDEEGTDENTQFKTRDWPAFPIPFDLSGNVPSDWTITNSVGEISDVALEYVQNGASAIEGLPQLSLGAFTTVDRWEIESYQNIRNLILDYANGENTRPLSIAVFGSPGSGKSFGVTEIAKNILPGKIEKLEFNVSQFTSLSDLGVAFQKVRDTILGGRLPLVFFDEFDSDRDGLPLGWIKSFLMPMQDGKFRDDSGEHPLGRCILVFAGGTASSFGEFVKQDNNFKNIKGPDFISRLRGTIDVLGPNPKDSDDKNYILRRALLLRSLCERNNIASVSPNIIRAMLRVPEYKHGARSMEAILDMSRIDGNTWEPVSLPSRSQLSLHVDADAFIKLVLGNKEDTTE